MKLCMKHLIEIFISTVYLLFIIFLSVNTSNNLNRTYNFICLGLPKQQNKR